MRLLLLAVSLLGSSGLSRHSDMELGSGTSVIALRSNGILVAAVDSQENYVLYLDGASSLNRRTVCKVAQPGPYFAIVAGLTHGSVAGSDGSFDAIAEAERAWSSGDDLNALAAHIREIFPRKLVPLLESLRATDEAAFRARYLNRVTTQVLLTGAEHGIPQIRILEFFETGIDPVSLTVRERGCPEECGNSSGAWFLGMHERIDEYLRANARAAAHADEPTLDRLIALEYEARPDLVGGPVSVIRVGKAGAQLIRGGACSPGGVQASVRRLP
jgi:hypothetical protein